ncbi:TetR family transcriptional regulator [Actinomadura viridis]|uniref:TetR family transcriptional regulator n=1 Tax=Actinomadura viridis TaxID=58110 RepID=UPI00368E6689
MSPRPKNTDRTDATRARLLDAAVTTFAERGFHGSTIRDIAGGAGLSTAALYVHYRTKEEVLYQISRDGHEETLALVRAAIASGGTPGERLERLFRDFTRYHARAHTTARVINYELAGLEASHRAQVHTVRRRIEAEVQDLVRQGVATGEFDVAEPALTTTALLSLGIDIARWYREGGNWSPDELADRYAKLALRLVGAAG